MQVFVAITVARQVQGEFVFVRLDKASTTKPVVENYLNGLTKQFNEMVATPDGINISCFCERGLFEVELEE